ncbi:MgtC/SapB family protein [Sulfurimonas marina]|uniref:DUF4010 domain-containing protein n=1 Tax=Sulfurimonas marina TaxID=2590551 RepID=A0A7M1AXW1_9BACT|nr:DUF4010 domain-containing protein [Sulfurimonas marina]QOP41222.1 DUF4010 domain-containing protein [Sulfurimonas marina]
MLENLLHAPWVELIVVVIAGFLIGLEIKAHRIHTESHREIGSVRTFAFISLIGYIFAKMNLYLYMVGYVAILTHLSLFYFFKLKSNRSGMILFLLSTLVYSFGIVVVNFNIWFLLIIFVAVVFISNLDKNLQHFYTIFDEREIETFAKLLLLSGVILPLLPQEQISEIIPISYFKVWLAVVIVSLFSYVGYVLKKYIFNDKGYLVTGILGGIYSSTATTLVLAKKASSNATPYLFASSIVVATTLMYLRLLGIAFAFNTEVAYKLLIPFIILTIISGIIVLVLYNKSKYEKADTLGENEDKNPLELGTAFLFAFLFIVMAILTHFVLNQYGDLGLNILSFIVGFTDIDPFVLSLLSSKFGVSIESVATAILIATGSNNILKALYAYIFSKNKAGMLSGAFLLVLGILTITAGFIA